MIRFVAATILLFSFVSNTFADFEKGKKAYKKGDYSTAVKEWRQDALRGNSISQYNLGLMYRKGQGVPQDNVMAHMWVNLAGSTLVGDKRKTAIKARDALEKRMTPKQITKAQRLAREWRPKR